MRQLSPRELAEALGVSESSLKRWVDAGKIAASRTEGGHRRKGGERARQPAGKTAQRAQSRGP